MNRDIRTRLAGMKKKPKKVLVWLDAARRDKKPGRLPVNSHYAIYPFDGNEWKGTLKVHGSIFGPITRPGLFELLADLDSLYRAEASCPKL